MKLPRFLHAARPAATCLLLLSAALTASEPAKVKDEPLLLRAYVIPNSTFTVPDPTSKTGARKLAPGVKPVPETDSRPDVKTWLEGQGVPFPPGAEAVYQANELGRPFIVVRQTQDNFDLLNTLLWEFSDGVFSQVEVEISAYELPATGTAAPPPDGRWSPERLEAMRQSVFLADRVVCLCKSGQEAETSHRQNKATSNAWVTPVIGPDGVTTDLQLKYRLKISGSGSESSREISVKSNISLADGCSAIVKSTTLPAKGKNGKAFIVVVRTTILSLAGWPHAAANKSPTPQ